MKTQNVRTKRQAKMIGYILLILMILSTIIIRAKLPIIISYGSDMRRTFDRRKIRKIC